MDLLLTQQILGVPICVLIYRYISIVCTASKLLTIHTINHVTNRYWLSLLLWRLFLMLKPTCVSPLSATNQNYTVWQNPTGFCPKKWMYPSTLRARPQSVFKKVQERRVTAEREVEARFAINNSVFKTFFFFFFFFYLKIAVEMKYGGREGSETEKSESLSCLVCPVCWRPGSQRPAPPPPPRSFQTCTCLQCTCLSEVYSLCLKAVWLPANGCQICQDFFEINLFWFILFILMIKST